MSNWSGCGRIGAVAMSVIWGVNVESVECKEDGGNGFDGKR